MVETYYSHKESCPHKDNSNTERRNIQTEEIDGHMVTVIYDCYCKTCGRNLYHFEYGHKE